MLMLRYLFASIAFVLFLAGCAGVRSVAPAVETDRSPDTVATQRGATWFEAHRDRPPVLRTFI